MESPCALGSEPACEVDGIAALDRDRLAPTLAKPYDPAVEDVDRRNHLELTC